VLCRQERCVSALPSSSAWALGDAELVVLGTADAAESARDEAANDAGGAAIQRRRVPDDAALAALIEGVVERDQRAFESCYDATYCRVFALLRRYLRDAARVEEVAEDVYFQVWRDAPRFDPARGRAMTWVLTIARSRALDALRRSERDGAEIHVDDEAIEALAPVDSQADPEVRLVQMRRVRALRSALQSLDPQPRQLVSLAFFRGLTHEEVAAETGLPLGTVKSTIRRSLTALKRALGPDLCGDAAL